MVCSTAIRSAKQCLSTYSLAHSTARRHVRAQSPPVHSNWCCRPSILEGSMKEMTARNRACTSIDILSGRTAVTRNGYRLLWDKFPRATRRKYTSASGFVQKIISSLPDITMSQPFIDQDAGTLSCRCSRRGCHSKVHLTFRPGSPNRTVDGRRAFCQKSINQTTWKDLSSSLTDRELAERGLLALPRTVCLTIA